MSDIVERLRIMQADLAQGAYYTKEEDPSWLCCDEAADEIERLRKVADQLAVAVRAEAFDRGVASFLMAKAALDAYDEART